MDRASSLREYLGETNEFENKARLGELFAELAQRLTFEEFRDLAESEMFGLVVTAFTGPIRT